MTPPRVTVAIACYNHGRYLAEAIESILAQSHPGIEAIVVDDGSTDDTRSVAARYASVRVIHQPNSGLAAARNTALAAATGDYIAFLDADDTLLPRAIEAGLAAFAGAPDAAFVFGTYRNVFEDGSPAPTAAPLPVDSDHYLRLLEGNFIAMHAAVLYRRELLASEGGFDANLRACEDYELYLRLSRSHPVGRHTTVVAEYRQHNSNMSHDHAMMLRHVLRVLERQRPFLRNDAHRRSFAAGVRNWKDYYGGLMVDEWRMGYGPRSLLAVLRIAPGRFLRRAVRTLFHRAAGRPVRVSLGGLRRLTPVSSNFGFDRGLPVDRHYIESFLASHAGDIRGRVLEIGDDYYSRTFGGDRVVHQEILHNVAGAPGATLIADLAAAPHIPDASFDCIILTQTLQYIYDLEGALRTLHRILAPGGVILATLPGISRLCTDQSDKEADCWRFTATSAGRLFAAHFGPDSVRVRTYGNVLAAVAFLEGLAAHELQPGEIDHLDPNYPVTIAVEAVRTNHATVPISIEDYRSALSPDRPRDLRPVVALRDA